MSGASLFSASGARNLYLSKNKRLVANVKASRVLEALE